MPSVDLVSAVRSATEKNIDIPAVLDAYGQFVNSPLGALELKSLDEVFSFILGNLFERFPKIAAGKAASNVRTSIDSFLSLTNNHAERVKDALRSELRKASKTMIASIGERFSRMSPEERRAIDATLRLTRASQADVLFKVEKGKPLQANGAEFTKFFGGVKSESPSMKELRYQNLVVEKGIFDRLLLKSKNLDFSIYVPSFFAKENLDELIRLCGVSSEHALLGHLKSLESQGSLVRIRPFLYTLVESQGVLSKSTSVPDELSSFLHDVGNSLVAMQPIDLDDIFALMREEDESRLRREREESERRLNEEARLHAEEERKVQVRQRTVAQTMASEMQAVLKVERTGDSILLGNRLNQEKFMNLLARKLPESEMASEVKTVGDYYLELSTLLRRGAAIVGASGSGKSTTLRRIMDGAALSPNPSRVIVIDSRGEHRGIAWKHKWQVFAFVGDSQAAKFRLRNNLDLGGDSSPEFLADLLQEWCLQIGLSCTEEDHARLASLLRTKLGEPSQGLDAIPLAISSEPSLAQIGQKLSKNLLSPGTASRIFSQSDTLEIEKIKGSSIFDISGRGLKDPTTKEERLIISMLLLNLMLSGHVENSLIVFEDTFDRFKSGNLRSRAAGLARKLRQRNNAILATSRSSIREFVGNGCLEIVHRLSGEKTISEELEGLRVTGAGALSSSIAFLPRGYALISSVLDAGEREVPSSFVKIEPLRF